jgi:hypothetical protein
MSERVVKTAKYIDINGPWLPTCYLRIVNAKSKRGKIIQQKMRRKVSRMEIKDGKNYGMSWKFYEFEWHELPFNGDAT